MERYGKKTQWLLRREEVQGSQKVASRLAGSHIRYTTVAFSNTKQALIVHQPLILEPNQKPESIDIY